MSNSIVPKGRDALLFGLAAAIASQVPTTIASINDPIIRVIAQFSGLLLVMALMWKLKPPEPPIPPYSSSPDIAPEPITIPDPPIRRFSLYVA